LLSNRRRAIQALGRFDDPRVKEVLKELAGARG
jgi:HEAT repeat protein